MISTGTAATYKGKPTDPREVSRALGVRYVVRGTVQRSGDEVRLALAMVDGESGAQHWAQSFTIERARLRSAVDDVAQQVARSLNVQMYRSGAAPVRRCSVPSRCRPTILRCRAGASISGACRARTSWPPCRCSSKPWPRTRGQSSAGAAWPWSTASVRAPAGCPTAPRRSAASSFASARLDELDSEHLFALLAKQNLTALAGDWEGHVTVARMTIQRYPNHAPSYSGLGLGQVSLGRFDECVELTKRAIRLSPRDPLLGAWHLNLGICHFMRGEYSDAAASERLAVQLVPTLPVPPLILAASLARDGKADEGRAVVAMHLQRHPAAKADDVPKLLRGDAPPFAAGRARLMDSLRELGMP